MIISAIGTVDTRRWKWEPVYCMNDMFKTYRCSYNYIYYIMLYIPGDTKNTIKYVGIGIGRYLYTYLYIDFGPWIRRHWLYVWVGRRNAMNEWSHFKTLYVYTYLYCELALLEMVMRNTDHWCSVEVYWLACRHSTVESPLLTPPSWYRASVLVSHLFLNR